MEDLVDIMRGFQAAWDEAEKSSPKTEAKKDLNINFFGKQPIGTINETNEADVKDWAEIAKLADRNFSEDFQTMIPPEATGKDFLANTADKMGKTGNPIHASTVGMDQELSYRGLGHTYTDEDFKDLEALKITLHDLQAKLCDFEGRGENGKKFESQIANIKTKINELSDSMSQVIPEKK